MKFRVGCSGWSYRHWRGDFYPAALPSRRWFDHYARAFDTVELNGTFYRLPDDDVVRSWARQAPGDFVFAVKASRLITHVLKLRNCEEALKTYLERMTRLGDHLGPILFQLPPNLERDDVLLRDFFELLPRRHRYVFEFRHDSWWCDPIFKTLSTHGAGFCVFDMGDTKTPIVATGDIGYVRFHGPDGLGRGGYTDDELTTWAEALRKLEPARETFVFFNNDLGGHAPRDAIKLREMLK